MNDGLIDAFRHNAWATRELLAACQSLTEAQLHATAPGTYGTIIATLRHTLSSEGGYCARLTGERSHWDRRPADLPGLSQLTEALEDLTARWDRFLAHQVDAEQTSIAEWDDGIDRDVPAGVVLAQVLHHANEHRTQICTILSTIGVTPPALGLWEYAAATNRAPQRKGPRG